MSVTRIGIRRPDDVDVDAEPIYGTVIDDMEYEVFDSIDDDGGVIFSAAHEDVGLATWWRGTSLDEVIEFLEHDGEGCLMIGGGRVKHFCTRYPDGHITSIYDEE